MRYLGLWMESLGAAPALSKPDELRAAFQYARSLDVSDIYLQVYREGRAWFPSSVAGQEHLEPCLANGFDPLREALRLASENSIKVHAWINVFNLGLNSSARVLAKQGQEVLLTDNYGARIDSYSDEGKPADLRAEYFVLDAPKLWLDPAAPAVETYISTLVRELFETYPGFSGLHLDFFRYPYLLPMQPSSRIGCGFEFGYGEQTRANFTKECGIREPFESGLKGALRPKSDDISLLWDRWRRGRIGAYLERLRKIISQKTTLSVAAVAWPERAFFTAYQNWRTWLLDDQVDQVCLMSYTADDELFSHLIRQALSFQGQRSRLIAGCGAYLLKDVDQLARQITTSHELGAQGAIIFSYENLRKKGIDSSTLTENLGQRRRS